jgi:hypothetical protein
METYVWIIGKQLEIDVARIEHLLPGFELGSV